LSVFSAVYGRVARLRRSWYQQRPHARRQLDSPVISVGNLVVGGSGKTPFVKALAHLLRDMGERPAILSRGYGRRRSEDGVIVVSKDQKATGERADFMMKENIVILTGNVVVSQGQNVMRGDKLIVELNTSKAHMEAAGTGGKPGRVQGLFVPSDKDDKKDGKDKDKSSKAESGKKKHKSKSQSEAVAPIH